MSNQRPVAVTCIRWGKSMDSAPGSVPGAYMHGAGGLLMRRSTAAGPGPVLRASSAVPPAASRVTWTAAWSPVREVRHAASRFPK